MPQGSQLAALNAFIMNLRANLVTVTTSLDVVLFTGGSVQMSDQACGPLGAVVAFREGASWPKLAEGEV